MCLILLAYESHPDYPVIVATNRDEFYGRPSQAAHFWPDVPHVLAGRDEEAGGTWCGVTTHRRLAAVTNFREPPNTTGDFLSRGDLVADFLRHDIPPREYMEDVSERADRYRGFNLIAGDAGGIYYISNRGGRLMRIEPGVHGLSNDLMNVPWFKVTQGKAELSALLETGGVTTDALFDILASEDRADDADLPDTGFGRHWERILSPRFIRSEDYGTRSSTVILIDREDNLAFHERTFRPGEDVPEERTFMLPADAPAAHSE